MENNSEGNVGRWVDDRLATLSPPEGWQPDVRAGLADLERRRYRRSSWHRGWTWTPALAVVIIFVCASAFPVTRVSAQRCVNACVVLWNNLAGSSQLAQGEMTVGARRPAPDFRLSDSAGRSVQLSELRGQVVLLNFWATWCGPCKVEIPWFVEFEHAYGEAGLTVLGVSLDDDGWKSVRPYIKAKRVEYRVMLGNDEIARMYGGLGSLPTTFMIDKAGRIAMAHVGLVEKRTYEEELKTLIAEK
jgi:peroxiredoxin